MGSNGARSVETNSTIAFVPSSLGTWVNAMIPECNANVGTAVLAAFAFVAAADPLTAGKGAKQAFSPHPHRQSQQPKSNKTRGVTLFRPRP
jgi:hypothetical protein